MANDAFTNNPSPPSINNRSWQTWVNNNRAEANPINQPEIPPRRRGFNARHSVRFDENGIRIIADDDRTSAPVVLVASFARE